MNSIKKALLAGMGAALITKEKAEETLNDFVQQGRIDAKDAKAMARQMVRDGQRDFAAISGEVEDRVLDFTHRAGADARARIAELEARVAELQKQRHPTRKPGKRPKAKARGA